MKNCLGFKFFIIIIFLLCSTISNGYSANNMKKIIIKEYKNGNEWFEYFTFENFNMNKYEKNKYLGIVKSEGKMFKSIDGGKNWYWIEIEKPQKLSFDIYPNPSSNFLNINFNNFKNEIDKIEVYNLEGILQNDFIIFDYENQTVNISTLKQGMYLIVVHTVSGKINSMKFIKF
jgi:hypothetical protein